MADPSDRPVPDEYRHYKPRRPREWCIEYDEPDNVHILVRFSWQAVGQEALSVQRCGERTTNGQGHRRAKEIHPAYWTGGRD